MRDYELLKQIGARVRSQRELLGFTRDELSESLGVSVNFCSDIELGKKGMSLETLAKTAHTLNVSVDFIVFGKSESSDLSAIIALIESCDKDSLKYLQQIIKEFVLAIK